MSLVKMSHEAYLKDPAYGSSDIIKMSRSFACWKWRKENPEKPGRPLVIGSATHAILEANVTKNDELFKKVLVYEGGSSLTNGFKSYQTENPGFYCLDIAEHSMVIRMVKALLSDEEVMGYLKGAIAEPTIMTTFPDSELKVKCRPDYLHEGRGVSINIKTTNDASESGFIYAAKDYGYDWQSAFYIDILSKEYNRQFDEVHILVEKVADNEPVPIKIFSFDDSTISWARAQMRQIIDKIPECEKTGIWPKNRTFLETVSLPLYARKVVNL